MTVTDECVKPYLTLAHQAAALVWKKRPWLDRDDLVGQAMLSLVKLLKEFDPSKPKRMTAKQYLFHSIRNRLKDYVRGIVGRHQQKYKLVKTTPIHMELRSNKNLFGDWQKQPVAEPYESDDAVCALLKVVSPKHRVVIRCLLEFGSGNGANIAACALLGLSASRASQLKTEALAMLQKLGEEKVREILYGRDE